VHYLPESPLINHPAALTPFKIAKLRVFRQRDGILYQKSSFLALLADFITGQ
jgi:hypothetical protein